MSVALDKVWLIVSFSNIVSAELYVWSGEVDCVWPNLIRLFLIGVVYWI